MTPARFLLIGALALLLAGCGVFSGGGDDDPDPGMTPAQGGVIPGTPTRHPQLQATAVPQEPVTGDLPVRVTISPPFIWPAVGPITSFMGPQHPAGIDIGLNPSAPQPVRAMADGSVTHAGTGENADYGLYVTIDHGNGLTSLYAHLASLSVNTGDTVRQGQTLGIGGTTGFSSGDHLHLEVEGPQGRIDPLHVLPEGTPARGNNIQSLSLDCASGDLFMQTGAKANLDFRIALQRGESVARASIAESAPGVSASVLNLTTVLLETPVDFFSPAGDAQYTLNVTLAAGSRERSFECPFTVRTLPVAASFYVRAAPPASETDAADEPGSNAASSEAPAGGVPASTGEPEPAPPAARGQDTPAQPSGPSTTPPSGGPSTQPPGSQPSPSQPPASEPSGAAASSPAPDTSSGAGGLSGSSRDGPDRGGPDASQPSGGPSTSGPGRTGPSRDAP